MKAKLHYDQLAGQINEMLRHDADYAEVAQPEVDTQHSRNHQGTWGPDVLNLFPFPHQASAKNRKALQQQAMPRPCCPLATMPMLQPCYSPATALLQPCYSPATARVPQIVIILVQGQLATGVL